MNLHVTNDHHGFFPREIAKRIVKGRLSGNNLMVNLSQQSSIKHDLISYIPVTGAAIKKYINRLPVIDKVVFHPFNYYSPFFLKLLLQRFPQVRVYWVCWSYELYNASHLNINLYDSFSRKYVDGKRKQSQFARQLAGSIYHGLVNGMPIVYNREKYFHKAYRKIHYFASFLPSDYSFMKDISGNSSIKYLPFSYLSLEEIIPDLSKEPAAGNKIMLGHAASPDANHFELIARISEINPFFSIFLPLAYGDHDYGNLIKNKARHVFKDCEILETKLSPESYYQKLTSVGWAVFNVKVQQALGNILSLIWLGVKVFLDENTSSYKDLKDWGITVYSTQQDLNKKELTEKLDESLVKKNRDKLWELFKEEEVSRKWQPIIGS
jgi:hypothetical protein